MLLDDRSSLEIELQRLSVLKSAILLYESEKTKRLSDKEGMVVRKLWLMSTVLRVSSG